MGETRTVRVGCAQYAPQFFDKEGTLRKALSVLEEAGRLGLDLVVFPETWFAAYPYWRGSVSVRRSTELAARMQESALRIPGPETEVLAEAARRARVNVVMGCNELSDLPGSRTLYNTLLFIGREGKVLGRHRKLTAVPEELREEMRYNLAAGGSCVVNPAGLFVREPVFEEEALVWAEIDLRERDVVKAYFDAVGHYARWDVLQLHLRREPTEPTWLRRELAARQLARLPRARVRELSDRFSIPEERVEALLEAAVEELLR